MRYHNAAGTSWPKPGPVLAAADHATSAAPSRWADLFDDAHQRVAAHFGVSPSTLLITPSCTAALAVAVADLPWTPGDRALTSHMEHHALVRPLTKLGVELGVIPRSADGPFDLAVLEGELRRGGVRLVAASMASNVTGELLPWRRILDLAHHHGAVVLLDGAQLAGWTSLDLLEMGVDLFAFAGHKGPQAPSGVGGLYVRPGLVMDTPGASCGPELCESGPGYCDTGSANLPALCGLAAGLDWMREQEPLAEALDAARGLREHLQAIDDVRVLGSPPGVPSCAFVVAGRSPTSVAAALRDWGVIVSGGLQCAPMAHQALGTAPTGAVRISFGPGQTPRDADALAVVLGAL